MRRSLACDSLKKEKEQRTVTGVTTHMCGSLYHAIEIPRGTGTDEPRVEEPFLSHLSPLRPKPPRAQTSMNSLFAFARKKQPGSKNLFNPPVRTARTKRVTFSFKLHPRPTRADYFTIELLSSPSPRTGMSSHGMTRGVSKGLCTNTLRPRRDTSITGGGR